MPIIYLDIETDNSEGFNGLDFFGGRVVTVQLLLPNGNVVIIKDPTQPKMNEIKDILESNLIIGHNLRFDSKFLKQRFGITLKNVYDTQIAEIILSGNKYVGKKDVVGLKDLVYRYCGKKMDKAEQTGFMYGVPLTMAQQEYAANDLRHLPEIFKQQQTKIKVKSLETIINLEMRVIPALVWLELSGINVDLERLDLFRIAAVNTRDAAKVKLFELLGNDTINLNSPIQLIKALNLVGIHVTSASKEELAKFDHPVLDALKEFKTNEKLLNTFIYKMPGYVNPITGRVHAEYYQIGAVTGRFSCRKPNMQQQPSRTLKNWKEIFVAGDGKRIVTADYSQIELRIVGQVAKDQKYIDAYNTAGVDLHIRTAAALFNVQESEVTNTQRSMAKAVNFGLNYGMWANGLVKRLKADANVEVTPEEAQAYAEGFQKMYPDVTAYLDKASREGLKNMCVRTMAGRLIEFENPESTLERQMRGIKEKYKKKHGSGLPYLDEQNIRSDMRRGIKGSVKRQSKNYPIQGFCADLVKNAMGNLFPILEPLGVKFIATVHDELVFECDEGQTALVRETVEKEMIAAGNGYFPDIPCKAEVFDETYWHKE